MHQPCCRLKSQKYNRFFKTALSAYVILLVTVSQTAYANPEGGSVVQGQATFQNHPKHLVIEQSSHKAIIDWKKFNIEHDEHTEFRQPDSSSLTLNRIRQNDPSQINGRLSANGRIILVNPNGVVFGANSKVDVGSLVATTADIDDMDFMNGKMDFKHAGHSDAQIINQGTITAAEAGLIGFVAPGVQNDGVIRARLGKVHLSSGETFSMDMAGDGLLNIAVEKDRLAAQVVKNNGFISADGGEIMLNAAAARQHVESLIVNKGTLQAEAVGVKNGKIILSAKGSNASNRTGRSRVENSGKIIASGLGAQDNGGLIDVLGDEIHLQSGSQISAAGNRDGGQIRIGGDYQGQGDIARAITTVIDENTLIDVSSLYDGNAGRAIVWSDEDSFFKGHIDAKGGALKGDGGFIEVSGKRYLDFSGTVDATAQNGKVGDLLLDPTDIEITTANAAVTGSSPFQPNADNAVSTLNVTTLQSALAGANVTVQTRATGSQPGNITVSSPISWASGRTLTLDAHNDIIVNATMTATNTSGNLVFTAGNDVALNATVSGTASLTFQPKTLTNSIGLAGGAGQLNLTTADLANITSGWGSINFGSATMTGDINANAQTWNNAVTMRTSGAGAININGTQNFGNRNTTLTSRNMNIAAGLNAGGGNVTLTLRPDAVGVTSGIGDGQTGTFNFTNTELGFMSGWGGSVTFGLTGNTAAMNIGGFGVPNSNMTFINGNGLMSINSALTFGGRNAVFQTNNLADITNNISGTGTITFLGDANATSIGIGDSQAGDLQFSNAELGRLVNGFNTVAFGRTTMTGAMNVGTYTWNDPLNLTTHTGLLRINGKQTMVGNQLYIRSNNLDIAADLEGAGALRIDQINTGDSIGLGDSQAGTLQLSNAELDRILDGWASIQIGRTDATVPVNMGGYTWRDPLTVNGQSGGININGAINMGANSLVLTTRALNINNLISGTGFLTIQPQGNISMGIGSGAGGSFNLSNTSLNNIASGFNEVIFGSTGSTQSLNVVGRTWNNSVRFRTGSGVITVAGDQNMETRSLRFDTDADIALNAKLISTGGNLSFRPVGTGTTMAIAGTGASINLSTTELDNIEDGWSEILFGNPNIVATAAMTVNSYTFNDNVRLYTNTGAITFAGAVDMQANNLDVTSRAAVTINNTLSGTGTLLFYPQANNSSLGLAGSSGNLSLNVASLDNIGADWSEIRFGRIDTSGTLNVNTYSNWRSNLRFMTGSGIITVAGQNYGDNDVFFETNANMAISAAQVGTGNLSIAQATAGGTSMTLNTVGTSGLNFTSAELNFISNGWNSLSFGRTDATTAFTANNYTWNDSVTFRNGSGLLTIAGANAQANNLTVLANGDVAITGAVTGTGVLTLKGTSASTSIGVGGASGILNLTSTEIANITNGWSRIEIGDSALASTINIGASTWNDPVHFLTAGNINLSGLLTNTETSGTSIVLATTAGNFVNSVTGTALSTAGSARYLVYSTSPLLNTIGDIAGFDKRYNKSYTSYGPTLVTETGHMFFYSIQPILTVTANNFSREYGLTNPLFTVSFSGFIDGDTDLTAGISGTAHLTTAATQASNVGSYTITAGLGSLASLLGYGFNSFVDGSLTIDPATLTVTANDKTREYGLSNPTLDGVVTGFRNSDTQAVISGLVYNTSATQASNVGNYLITASGASATNYIFNYVDGSLTIDPATLTVTANNFSRTVSAPNPSFTATINGFRNGDNNSVISGLSFSTLAQNNSPAGLYTITPFGAIANNYLFNYITGQLTITGTAPSNDPLPSTVVSVVNPSFFTVNTVTAAPQNNPVIFDAVTEVVSTIPLNVVIPFVDGFERLNGQVFVKTNRFSTRLEAERLAESFTQKGQQALVEQVTLGGQTGWVVKIGPFESEEEAAQKVKSYKIDNAEKTQMPLG